VTQVLLCENCDQKERRIQIFSAVLIVLGFVLAFVLSRHFDVARQNAFFIGMVCCAPGILLTHFVGDPVRVGFYDDKTVEFSFKSSEYANKFRMMNQGQAGSDPSSVMDFKSGISALGEVKPGAGRRFLIVVGIFVGIFALLYLAAH
jgi:hypothetical protein